MESPLLPRPTASHAAAALGSTDGDRPPSPSEESERSFAMTVDDGQNKGISVMEATYHIICVIAGSGILQLPFALNQSGWIGVGLVLFAAFANNYSGKLLVKCLYAKKGKGENGRRLKGFSHIGLEAFGKTGELLVEVFAFASLLGCPIVYFILTGMNLEYLFGVFPMKVWMLLSALLVLVPFLIFKTLKEIAILSAFGVFATVVVIGTVVFYSIHDLPLNAGKVTHKFIDMSQFASALGSISFSFSGNFIYPEVEASMAHPQQFPLVLSMSMIIISIMYLVTAILGYASYGNLTDSPILNNLPPGLASNFAVFLITVHVLFAIPILLTTLALEVERRIDMPRLSGNDARQEARVRAALRCGLLLLIVMLAIAIPFFKDFMTLLGAVANTALIFVFPVVFDFQLFGFQTRSTFEKVFGIMILVVGVFGGVVGGFEAVVALVNDVKGVGGPAKVGGH
ncbi:transmembrane amino acid transporter protein-domain-containing protein [Chytriomyces sp. MP71]|nr:transmembrane amino acid transporter protein-domain-containing protein [Chytriomyces sp. MP71]